MRYESPAPPNIPDYELLREIGRGSYGVVWLARGITGQYRAVKIVWRAMFEDPGPYEREFRGIREFAAVSLVAPRQLALLHVGRNDAAGFFYYVMELADDLKTGREIDPAHYVPKTLKEVRLQQPRFTIAATIKLGVELAEGLAELHQRKLVHRDIKPSNIIYVGGALKLADIGLVAAARNSDQTVTRVGNPGYMPPDFPGTPSADVYGVGKVLYELATGRDREDFPALPDLGELPDRKGLLELNEILLKACSWKTEERYADAQALLDEFHLLKAGKSVRRLRATERHLSRALKAAAVLAVAAILAGAGAWAAWQQAKKEMALRADAERERDALARKRTYSGNLASAQAALHQGDLSRARKLLADLKPKPGEVDLRGFEWHALSHQAKGDPHQVIRRAGNEITKLVLSPDETVLAVHDRSNLITLYETSTHRELRQIPEVWKLAGFSADGNWLIGADADQVSMRWSVRDGKIDDGTEARVGLAIAPLGNDEVIALSRESPRKLRRWNFANRQEGPSIVLGIEDDGPAWNEFIASASSDGQTLVRAWLRNRNDRAEYRLTCVRLGALPTIQHRELGPMRPEAVGVDSTGPWVLFNSTESEMEGNIWRCGVEGWEQTDETLPRGTSKATYVSREGESLYILARQRELGWRKSTPESRFRTHWARGHDTNITELAVSKCLQHIYSAAADGSLLAWETRGPAMQTFTGWNPHAGPTGIVFTADGKKIWMPEDGSNCVLLDIATLTPIARAVGMRYPLSLSKDMLLGIGQRTGLVGADPATGAHLTNLMHDRSIRLAAVSGSGSEVAAIDNQDRLITNKPSYPSSSDKSYQWYTTVLFDSRESSLWMGNPNSRELVRLRWPGQDIVTRINLAARITAIRLVPGEGDLLLALDNGNIELRSVDSGALHKEVYSGSSAPQTMALSGDGRRLFVGGNNGDIHCFDLATWEEVHAFALGDGLQFHRLSCSPDGRTLAALTKRGTLYLLKTE